MVRQRYRVSKADQEKAARELDAALKQRAARSSKVPANDTLSAILTRVSGPTITKMVEPLPTKGRQNSKNLPIDAESNLRQTRHADYLSEKMGKPREEKKSLFNKTLDILLRPSRMSVGAIDEMQEAFYQDLYKRKQKGKGLVSSVAHALVTSGDEALHGAKQGITGKRKDNGDDMYQNFRDNLHALSQGRDPAKTVYGEKKLNKVEKAVTGFTLDVLVDPTTYMGFGLATRAVAVGGKAMKSKDVANLLEDTVRTAQKTKTGKSDLAAAAKLLAVDRAPVGTLKKKDLQTLSPEARILHDIARSAQKSVKPGRRGGAETAKFGVKKENLAASINHEANSTVRALQADEAAKFLQAEKAAGRGVRTVDEVKADPIAAVTWDLKGITDNSIRESIDAAARKELTDFPGLNNSLTRIRFDVASANKAGSNPVFKHTVFNGHWNDSAALAKEIAEEAPGYAAVAVKTPQEFAKRTAVHEVGHHASYLMPAHILKAMQKQVYDEAGKVGMNVNDFIKANVSGRATFNEKEFFAEVWTAHRYLGDKASPLVQTLGRVMEEHVKRIAPKTLDDAAAKKVIAAQEKALKEAAKKHADDAVKATGVSVDGLTEELTAAALRNMSPAVKRNVKVRFGTAEMVLPALGVARAARAVGTIPHVQRTIEAFHKTLNANYKIVPGITRLRNVSAGAGTQQVKAQVMELQSVFDPLSKVERKAMLNAYRRGIKTGTYRGGKSLAADGASVDDALKYFSDEVDQITMGIAQSGISPNELDSFLAPAFKFGDKNADLTRTGDWDQAWLQNHIVRNQKIEDPAHALFMYKQALTQAVTKRAMWKSFADEFGVPVPKNGIGPTSESFAEGTGRALAKLGHVQAVDDAGAPLRGLENFVFHPEIAESLKRINAVFRDTKSTNQFIDQYDKVLQGWKGLVTRYNPSFHTRTLLGEVMLGYLGGMKNIPGSYQKAAKVLRGRNEEFLGHGPQITPAGMTGNEINARNVMRNGTANVARAVTGNSAVVMRTKYGDLNADQIWHMYQQSGLKSGYASTDLVRNVDPLKTQIGGKINTKVQGLTEGVEDFGRMAHFIDVIRYSKAKTLEGAVEEAAEIVSKMHLDYTAVTGAEKSIATRLMPFYKWLRLSSPLMIEHLLTQPGKVLVVPKTMQLMSNLAGYDVNEFGAFPGGPDGVVPKFLKDHGAMPVGEIFGNTNYFDPTALFPLSGTAEATSPSKIMGMLTPAFKVPAELGLNQTFFGGKPQDDMKKYLLSQLPQTNFANNMVTPTDPDIPRLQRLAQFLANPGIQPNTEKRQRGETYQMREDALKHKKKVKEEKGYK